MSLQVPGRQTPFSLCPPGYFCWEGTQTEDWNAETSYRPYACPEATYCLGGIRKNITDESDFNSPQPCPLGQFCKEASTSPFGTGRCPSGFFCPGRLFDEENPGVAMGIGGQGTPLVPP